MSDDKKNQDSVGLYPHTLELNENLKQDMLEAVQALAMPPPRTVVRPRPLTGPQASPSDD